MEEECRGFYERAMENAWAIEGPVSRDDRDEFEALRRRLLRAIRRQPGDVRALLRHAESLSRMAAAEKRLSPQKERDLGENLARVLSRFEI